MKIILIGLMGLMGLMCGAAPGGGTRPTTPLQDEGTRPTMPPMPPSLRHTGRYVGKCDCGAAATSSKILNTGSVSVKGGGFQVQRVVSFKCVKCKTAFSRPIADAFVAAPEPAAEVIETPKQGSGESTSTSKSKSMSRTPKGTALDFPKLSGLRVQTMTMLAPMPSPDAVTLSIQMCSLDSADAAVYSPSVAIDIRGCALAGTNLLCWDGNGFFVGTESFNRIEAPVIITDRSSGQLTITEQTGLWDIAVFSSGQVALITWNSVSGKLYRLQCSSDGMNWSNVGEIVDVGTGLPIQRFDDGSQPKRLYRVETLPITAVL